jgi:hypothetical protein
MLKYALILSSKVENDVLSKIPYKKLAIKYHIPDDFEK